MQSSNIPSVFNIPWANSAVAPYVHAVPEASQLAITPGAASLTDGFVPLNFLTPLAGGVPPFGNDMNGILNQITAWLRWVQAGGPIKYNATFQTAIGGYPLGSIVQSATVPGKLWCSSAENNVTNPDTGGAGWTPVMNTVYAPLTGTGASGTWGIDISGNAASAGIPQNIQSTAYTAVLADANKSIHHPAADNIARIFTIPANASVPYPLGTTLTFTNEINVITISIISDTLTWSPSGTAGSRTLAANGMATAVKITSTKWMISGVGLT